MKKVKMLLVTFSATLLVLGMTSAANAYTITPATLAQWTGSETATLNPDEIAEKVGYTGPGEIVELYKQDVGAPVDNGSFSSSYKTTFDTDASDATISFVSGPYIIGNPIYLYVKDGNHVPAWYIFNLSAYTYNGDDEQAPWNGTDTIYLIGFWPDKGAISHVAIYDPSTSVPEPTSMMLLGLGLMGLAGVRRKIQR